MTTPLDRSRMDRAARTSSAADPATDDETALQRRLDDLHDAIAAMQSLDDLGSPEANEAAWQDMLGVQRQYDDVKKRLDAVRQRR